MTVSKLVYFASWLAAFLIALASAFWVSIVASGNYCWDAFAFTFGIAMPLGGGTLMLAVVPSSVFYLKKKQRRDLMSLWLAGCAFVILLVEAILLSCVIPQRGE